MKSWSATTFFEARLHGSFSVRFREAISDLKRQMLTQDHGDPAFVFWLKTPRIIKNTANFNLTFYPISEIALKRSQYNRLCQQTPKEFGPMKKFPPQVPTITGMT